MDYIQGSSREQILLLPESIADFRKDNTDSLRHVCRRFTLLCKEQDLFGGELVAIDGTKIKAVNANYKNISHRRLKRDLESANEKIAQYFKDLDFYDQQESSTHKTLSVKDLKKKIAALEDQKYKLQSQQQQLDKSPDGQISYTDPDSRSMMCNGLTDVAYTVFTAKPETSANQKLGLFHKDLFVYDKHKDSYLCPAGQTLTYKFTVDEKGRLTRYYTTFGCGKCPLKSKCTRGDHRRITRWVHEEVLDRMRERVRNNPDMMKKRRCIVEHPFGTMKRWMDQGFFLMRGLPKVRAEFSLTVFSYNLKRALKILGTQKLIAAVS